MPYTLPLSALLVACCLALAGCSAEVNVGGSSNASGEEIADELRDDYAGKTGIALERLTCEDVEAQAGEKFSCSGRNARGVQLEIDGKVTDTSGDGFDYSWHVAEAVAPGVLYERALRRQLEEDGVALAEVRCPLEVEVEVGEELRCRATDRGGSSRDVTLRLTDLDGGFEYQVGDEAPSEGPSA
jgi:Domain of unknown function (DUF4333)